MNNIALTRYPWIDWIKAIGIFLIIWSHQELPSGLNLFIWSFHVPLFFFISGYLNKLENCHKSFQYYFKKYFKGLIIPYFSLGFIAWCLWALKIVLHPGSGYGQTISIWLPLVGMLYGTSYDSEMIRHAVELWFFPALFLCHMLHYLVLTISKNYFEYAIICIIIMIIGYFSFSYSEYRLPWSAESSMVSLPFYCFGFLLSRLDEDKKQIFLCQKYIIIYIILQIIGIFVINDRIDVREGLIYNPYNYLLTAFFGISFMICLFRNIKENKFINFISKNTIVIFSFQSTAGLLISAINHFFLKINPQILFSGYLTGFIYSIFVLISLCLFCTILRKIAPWAIGEWK